MFDSRPSIHHQSGMLELVVNIELPVVFMPYENLSDMIEDIRDELEEVHKDVDALLAEKGETPRDKASQEDPQVMQKHADR